MFPLPSARTCEAGLPLEARVPDFWDSVIPVSSGTCTDVVCSSLPQHGPGKPVLVLGYCISTYYFEDRPHRQGHGSGSRLGLPGWDFRDPKVCLHRDTVG